MKNYPMMKVIAEMMEGGDGAFFLQFKMLLSSSIDDLTNIARNLWNPYALHP